jgi:hypothetical protein
MRNGTERIAPRMPRGCRQDGFTTICTRRWLLLLTTASTFASPILADPIRPGGANWTVSPNFQIAGQNEYNISGIACAKAQGAERHCLAIDDELTFAEHATISAHAIRPAGVAMGVELVGGAAPIGTPPQISCDEIKPPADLDGEAVAEANGTFYVIGSHGCGRSKGAYRTSSFLTARLSTAGAVSLSYRISEALQRCPVVREYFGKRLELVPGKTSEKPSKPDENGLNIEGLAAIGQRLWVGLRSPSVLEPGMKSYSAYMISMDADAVFSAAQPLHARLHAVPLGKDRGIRDLAPLADGRILILSGPRTSTGADFALELYDPLNGRLARLVALALPSASGTGKAEGLLVVGEGHAKASLIVLRDGLPNGAPFEVDVPIPARAAHSSDRARSCDAAV